MVVGKDKGEQDAKFQGNPWPSLPGKTTIGSLPLPWGVKLGSNPRMQGHKYRFYRAGGVDQVQIKTGSDLLAITELDQKLWVALSCPVVGLQFDERTLALIDADGDGRVHAPELISAITWSSSVLSDVDDLGRSHELLDLSHINTDCEEGQLIALTIKALLRSLGKTDDTTIGVEQVKESLESFNRQSVNGDGILPPAAVVDDELRSIVSALLAGVAEPKLDRSGDAGVDRAQVVAFFEAVRARLTWLDGALSEGRDVLGAATAQDIGAFLAVRAKVEDFYARVCAVDFDARALPGMNREETAYVPIGEHLIDAGASDFESFPLAQVQSGAVLPLVRGLNPAWVERIAAFRALVVRPLLGEKDALSEREYRELLARLTPQLDWQTQKPSSAWDAIAEADLRKFVEQNAEERILDLVDADQAAAAQAGAIESVEKLVRYKRDLLRLANNFVSFRDFYVPDQEAIFQIGTLYIDQRALHLVMRVTDAVRHAAMAPASAIYLLYCDAKNANGDKMSIVAAVTNGDVENLSAGRNALFYDRKGVDWDATITKIIENPISIRQAAWTPYKKFLRLIEDQINKRAAAAEAEADANMTASASKVDAATKGEVKTPPPAPKKIDIGVVAALGVAVGGITAALGVLLQAFLGLGMWMPLGVLGMLLLISGPSMAVAWLKLRRRNIGPLLDANGWAINVLPRINVPLGHSLTSLARLPKGAARDLADPFAEKKTPWWRYVLLLLVIGAAALWYLGKLDRHLPPKYHSTTILGDAAPAQVKAKPEPEGQPAAAQ